MPRIPDTTNAQTTFLRAFRASPAGPSPDQWPTPAILRRWLRRSGFRRALHSLERSLRVRADFLLATAAASAADHLTGSAAAVADDPKRMLELLRLLHVRQRFTADPAPGADPREQPHPAPDTTPRANTPEDDQRLFNQQFEDPNCAFHGLRNIVDDPGRLHAFMELYSMRGDHKYDRFLLGFPESAHLDLQPPRT